LIECPFIAGIVKVQM